MWTEGVKSGTPGINLLCPLSPEACCFADHSAGEGARLELLTVQSACRRSAPGTTLLLAPQNIRTTIQGCRRAVNFSRALPLLAGFD